MRIVDCYSETSDIGPDIVIVETENSGFTLLMSRSGDPYDHMKVYFDDEEILEGSRSKEILNTLSSVKNDLTGEALNIYNGILAAIEKSI
ncbi:MULTISPECIES: hypothetical protein [Alteromonadales]|jgi:hypothetical protein|uniref:Uncharacterized protein n=3 Tax=Pseudomonadati TaxID=3379134 RepID=A0ABS0WKG4_9ALTE|nr:MULTISPECIES: hypothetical protein [Alteromonadales]MBJ2138970.1 hypothetical protein [Paraglaciecola chathamensis]MCL1150768.1 hypothetical protein [Shewanella ulleungensis]MDO6561617.1 hypothetical protein [Paraglaciecola chathamensis]PKG78920.1 hypothetical protein CXF80_11715 [Shewanella sp. Actino-trap-3]PKI07699.1 hypothetical protein CXF78_04190 [Shewanella sp. 11B5]|tara:strand:+ start:244 stop:513 length:270 start_codon:yes stop_codon:yes gene_type:complete